MTPTTGRRRLRTARRITTTGTTTRTMTTATMAATTATLPSTVDRVVAEAVGESQTREVALGADGRPSTLPSIFAPRRRSDGAQSLPHRPPHQQQHRHRQRNHRIEREGQSRIGCGEDDDDASTRGNGWTLVQHQPQILSSCCHPLINTFRTPLLQKG